MRASSGGRRGGRRTSAAVMASEGSGGALAACEWCPAAPATAVPNFRNILPAVSLTRLSGGAGAPSCAAAAAAALARPPPPRASAMSASESRTLALRDGRRWRMPTTFRSEARAMFRSEAFMPAGILTEAF